VHDPAPDVECVDPLLGVGVGVDVDVDVEPACPQPPFVGVGVEVVVGVGVEVVVGVGVGVEVVVGVGVVVIATCGLTATDFAMTRVARETRSSSPSAEGCASTGRRFDRSLIRRQDWVRLLQTSRGSSIAGVSIASENCSVGRPGDRRAFRRRRS
jgi:hypothetical protein